MRHDEFDAIIDRVGEGQSVDWQAAANDATDAQHRLIHQLRVIEKVARSRRAESDAEARGEVPERWAHLAVLDRLASGPFGHVYRARDSRLDRDVALKLLAPGPVEPLHSRDIIAASDAIHEARVLARVRHPNVVSIYGAERSGGAIGVWMELVHGKTVGETVDASGPYAPEETVLIGMTVSRALAAIHRGELVHGAINPQNVMREFGGRIVLMDQQSIRGGREGSAFAAPEVTAGARPSIASDIYSLGALLFYLVSGVAPVRGSSLDEVREAHATGQRVLIDDVRPDLPPSLAAAIARATAADPKERYRTAGEMAEALASALTFRAPGARTEPGRRWLPAVALGAALLAVAGFAWMFLARSQQTEPTYRQLTYHQGRVVAARFSPDGHTVVFSAEWNAQQREIFTSTHDSVESRPLGIKDASVLSVSSKGDVALLLRPRFFRGYVESGTLARVPLSGGTPRELLENVQEADWSPDGASLAIVRTRDGATRLEYPAGNVLYSTGGWVSHISVSPDGGSIAFIDHPTPADDSGAIAVVDLERQKRTLSEGWSSAQGLAWAPDGDEIFFTAARAGNSRALHVVDVRGNTRVVRAGIARLRIHDIAGSGRMLITAESTRVGAMALAPGAAQEREMSWLDWSIARDLSDDGGLLLFNESGEGGGKYYAAYLRRMDGAPPVRLTDGSGMAISPDGKWVLATRPAAAGPPSGLLLVPIGAGEIRQLPHGTNRYQQWGTWFPNGRRVLFAGNEPGRGSRLYVQDLDSGAPRPITAEGVFLASSQPLSPNGAWVAAVDSSDVPTLFPVEAGTPRRIPNAAAGELPIHWGSDGAIYMWKRGEAPARIWRVDPMSGARHLWKELMPPDPAGVHEILRITMSRDARAYAYSYTRELSTLHVAEGLR